MSGKFKKIKDISAIGSADIIGSGISAMFWFYLATLIDAEAYGEISYFISIAQVASAISLLGATNTLVVYSAKKIPIHATLYLVTLTIGIISAIVVYFVVDNFSTAVLVLGYLVFALAYSDLLGKKYFKTYTKFLIAQKILMVTLALGLYTQLGRDGVIVGIAIGHSIGIIRIIAGFRDTHIDFKLFKEKIHFISSNFMHTLSASFAGSIDKLIIAPLFGFALLGNYSLGLQFLAMLGILPMIVSKYLIPQDSSGVENKKLKKIIVLISCGIGALGFTIGPEVIVNFFPKFTDADSILRIVSISIVPTTITMTYQSKFLGKEKGHYLLYSGLIKSGILILGIFVLGGLYQIEGIAVSLVIATIIEMVFTILISKRIK